jgi:hypothetical protein
LRQRRSTTARLCESLIVPAPATAVRLAAGHAFRTPEIGPALGHLLGT